MGNFHLSTWKTSYFLGKPAGFAGVPKGSVYLLASSEVFFPKLRCQQVPRLPSSGFRFEDFCWFFGEGSFRKPSVMKAASSEKQNSNYRVLREKKSRSKKKKDFPLPNQGSIKGWFS